MTNPIRLTDEQRDEIGRTTNTRMLLAAVERIVTGLSEAAEHALVERVAEVESLLCPCGHKVLEHPHRFPGNAYCPDCARTVGQALWAALTTSSAENRESCDHEWTFDGGVALALDVCRWCGVITPESQWASERAAADLTRLREQIARAVEHGYTEGDVNHNVQPIIGWMRVQIDRGEPMGIEAMTTAVERLYAACDAETAWLNTPPRAEGDSKQ